MISIVLIKTEVLEKIIDAKVNLIFRRWKRASAKAGGTQMTQLGVIGIDAVDVVNEHSITQSDAVAAGFASKKELLASLPDVDLDIYRIKVRYLSEDPRKALRSDDNLSKDEIDEIIEKLHALDSRSKRGDWTLKYLQIIHDRPATYSGVLAKSLGLEIPQFKPWVRKLKALGLTESLEVGYRLSPQGEKVLNALKNNL